MNTLFVTTIKLDKVLEDGTSKKVSEEYLVDAVNHADAETRIIKEITPYCSGDLDVAKVAKVKYSEVFESNDASDDKYYKVRCVFVSLDENSGSEKRQNVNMLVMGSSVDKALKNFNASMDATMSDYEVESIAVTKILGYFKENS